MNGFKEVKSFKETKSSLNIITMLRVDEMRWATGGKCGLLRENNSMEKYKRIPITIKSTFWDYCCKNSLRESFLDYCIPKELPQHDCMGIGGYNPKATCTPFWKLK